MNDCAYIYGPGMDKYAGKMTPCTALAGADRAHELPAPHEHPDFTRYKHAYIAPTEASK